MTKEAFMVAAVTALLNSVMGVFVQPIAKLMQTCKYLDMDYWRVMSSYCEDLTEAAEMGKGQDAIGRDNEINTLINTLSVEGKANVCITGDPGVGKTALVEGLAYRIAKGEVPDYFKNKKIIKVNMVSLIAGNAYDQGGGAVNRMRALFDNAKEDPNIILFIDEFHQIVQCHAAELFKTYLDRPGVHVIAATTTSEFSYISQDPALERRFKKIVLDEPDQNQTLDILKNIKKKVENNTGVKISDAALMSAVDLTGKYMKSRTYPDKAIDVINLAAQFVSRQNKKIIPEVTEEDIQKIISSETGIPLGNISEAEAKVLDSMNDRVSSGIVGQDTFVGVLCDAVRKSRSGLCDVSRPRASFMFTGTPGVGKTALAECIGRELKSLIKLDVSNSKIGDSLLEQVWKKPYSVVLFDNVDKADKATLDKILGILENGFICDSYGKKIDFTNSIVIMTANTGSNIILKDDGKNPEELRRKVLDEVEEQFGIHFVSKLDDVLIFNKLNQSNAKDILRIFADKLENQLSTRNVKLEIGKDVIENVSKIKVDHKKGAIKLKKVIEEKIEKPISIKLLKGEIKSGDIVLCKMDGNDIKFDIIRKN